MGRSFVARRLHRRAGLTAGARTGMKCPCYTAAPDESGFRPRSGRKSPIDGAQLRSLPTLRRAQDVASSAGGPVGLSTLIIFSNFINVFNP